MCLTSYRNTSGSLGEQEMLWEHELDRNMEFMFSIWYGKHHVKKKENNLLTFLL